MYVRYCDCFRLTLYCKESCRCKECANVVSAPISMIHAHYLAVVSVSEVLTSLSISLYYITHVCVTLF